MRTKLLQPLRVRVDLGIIYHCCYRGRCWKCRSTQETSVVFFFAPDCLFSNSAGKNSLLTTLWQGISLLCQPETTISSYEGIGFCTHHWGYRIFETIRQQSKNWKCMVVSCVFVPFSASNLMLFKGHGIVSYNH